MFHIQTQPFRFAKLHHIATALQNAAVFIEYALHLTILQWLRSLGPWYFSQFGMAGSVRMSCACVGVL